MVGGSSVMQCSQRCLKSEQEEDCEVNFFNCCSDYSDVKDAFQVNVACEVTACIVIICIL